MLDPTLIPISGLGSSTRGCSRRPVRFRYIQLAAAMKLRETFKTDDAAAGNQLVDLLNMTQIIYDSTELLRDGSICYGALDTFQMKMLH